MSVIVVHGLKIRLVQWNALPLFVWTEVEVRKQMPCQAMDVVSFQITHDLMNMTIILKATERDHVLNTAVVKKKKKVFLKVK